MLRSDNGPQYSSREFSSFAEEYGFKHVTSSPRYPQSNGQAERAVQTVKKMLKKSSDPCLALLNYRATPLPWCKLSPAQLLMGRPLRTRVPVVTDQLIPNWPYLGRFRDLNKSYKERQKEDFDRRHRTHDLSVLTDNSEVWVTSEKEKSEGFVVSPAEQPRSYLVETPTGTVRRNRSQLNVKPSEETGEEESSEEDSPQIEPLRKIMTRSQGTVIKPPERFISFLACEGRCDSWHYL